MYHSVTFGEKNTYDDWRLVPSSRPLFNPPAQKVTTIDIPGGDGLLDLSEALTGYPVYQNRTGSMEFIVLNDFRPWEVAYSDIMNYLHGRRMRAILEDDPAYFYEGRFTVNKWASQKDWSRITIDYSVGPYKWAISSSIDPWKWDPFNFQNGLIRTTTFANIRVTTQPKTLIIDGEMIGKAPVCPTFHVSIGGSRVVRARFVNPFLGIEAEKLLRNGENQIPELVFLSPKGEKMTLQLSCDSGEATVSIEFHEGSL